jgi:glycosyltransferase involved in cell wall biosynthesis
LEPLKPLVSVVIPTYRRPQLVTRAVQSALAQTLQEIEVIVVIDGPDESTRNALAQINDSRLNVIELPIKQGSCKTRNAGVAAADAKWVAFLDDDDEWMPQKLALQLATAERSEYKFPVVTSYLIARTATTDETWPRRIPQHQEPISEYLFVRNTFFQGEGLIQTSTIFTSKELLEKRPFLSQQCHDDWDWLLTVDATEGVGVEFVPQVLSIWHLEKNHSSVSRVNPWQNSLRWIQGKRNLVTPRAYSSFILAEVTARAAKARDGQAFFLLLWEAIRFGKPQLKDIGLYFGMWFCPPDTRKFLRNLLTKKQGALSI